MDRKRLIGLVCLVTTAALPMLAGCAMTHSERKAKAAQHWGQVRAKVKVQLAEQQFDRGRVDEALVSLNEALTLDQENAVAHRILAQCLMEQGKVASARRAIEQAAVLEPGSAEIAAVRGVIAERRGAHEEALESYRQARALDDTEVQYLVSEAECLVVLDRVDDARLLLNSHLVDYDNDLTLHALLGEIALRQGDEILAVSCFRTVLSSGRYDPIVAEEFAILATRHGHYTEAQTTLERILGDGGKETPHSVRRALAECYLALNSHESAKRVLRCVVDENPNDAQAWFLLAKIGIASSDNGTTSRAAAHLRRLAPGDPQSLLITAYAALREKRLDHARAALHQVLARDETDVLAHCMLGMVAERGNDPQDARVHYRRALELDPQCRWARSALRELNKPTSAPRNDAFSDSDGDVATSDRSVALRSTTSAK